MLYQANMPKSFWAEAITTAAYLINRLLSEAINDEIPYENGIKSNFLSQIYEH